jgi:ribonuclease P protein component
LLNNHSEPKAFLPSPLGFTFRKSERLCSKKAFDLLFLEGKSIFSYPVKFVYSIDGNQEESKVLVAFGVSKKNFKKAVKRNKIKRTLREAYRNHKFIASSGKVINIMLIYTSREILTFRAIEAAVIKGLKELTNRVEKDF